MNQIKIVEEIKTHIFCSVACSFFENRADYEKMCKNTVLRGRTQMTIWRTLTACWIPKATHTHTHTHTQYVILIAFPLQQRLTTRLYFMLIRILLVLLYEYIYKFASIRRLF